MKSRRSSGRPAGAAAVRDRAEYVPALSSAQLRRVLRAFAGVVVAVVAVVVAYAGLVAYRHTRPVTLPLPSGRFAVGRAEVQWIEPMVATMVSRPADRAAMAAGVLGDVLDLPPRQRHGQQDPYPTGHRRDVAELVHGG
jgi:hypothetical protein